MRVPPRHSPDPPNPPDKMRIFKSLRTYACVFTAICLAGSLKAQTLVYSDNFESSHVDSKANPYLGGWFSPQVGFNTWNGSYEASISGSKLNVTTSNETRSAGILIAPSSFPGAGSYTLSFDVAAYTGDSNDTGLVTVWSGKGYDLSRSSGNALVLDTLSSQLRTEGTAKSSLLGSYTFTTTGGGKQFNFDYDGISAVALFFGANTKGYPFPTVSYDNVSIRPMTTIPEPSVAALVAIVAVGACVVRRRNA